MVLWFSIFHSYLQQRSLNLFPLYWLVFAHVSFFEFLRFLLKLLLLKLMNGASTFQLIYLTNLQEWIILDICALLSLISIDLLLVKTCLILVLCFFFNSNSCSNSLDWKFFFVIFCGVFFCFIFCCRFEFV